VGSLKVKRWKMDVETSAVVRRNPRLVKGLLRTPPRTRIPAINSRPPKTMTNVWEIAWMGNIRLGNIRLLTLG
jgi:hypothetical protein